tara:strand:- start:266 stop:502 length:237 start_codon:yes stop_codon:yes gene_type:complete
MDEIDKLIEEAEHGVKDNYVERKITPEARDFWDTLLQRVRSGVEVKPYRIINILKREFDIEISDSAMRRYIKQVSDGK